MSHYQQETGYQQRCRDEEARFQAKSDALAARRNFSRDKYEAAVRTVTGWLVPGPDPSSAFARQVEPQELGGAAPTVS